ncbi:hypothetical protein IC006_2783 [Sulfuracidifex tepidarius]|uniref:Protein kinase domain-containing protein n=1 Tax=Sulfuracidifex tepidarius TaxID=1294262 RepID=A0A510DZ36_9CREN|nr:DUF1955 domain-containing protein [Sulfuracidifex tepidarius]BBG25447.1 hypothetical protein IC006_2783 [Sulfuracidifex tepidarius]
MKGKLVLSAVLGVVALALSIYVSSFSLMYGQSLINVSTIYSYSLIISLLLLFASMVMLTYAYSGKVDLLKTLLYPFAIISLLFSIFYPTLLVYKLISFALSLSLFQLGFKKARLSAMFFVLDFFLSVFFIYSYLSFHSIFSLFGLGISIFSIILTNKGNLKLWSVLMAIGIPLIMFGVQISPFLINYEYVGGGALLTAISLVPQRKKRSPFNKAIEMLNKGNIKGSIEIIKKNRNKMSKLELAKFSCELISKGNCEFTNFVYDDKELLNLVVNSNCSINPLLRCLVSGLKAKEFQEVSKLVIKKNKFDEVKQVSDLPNFPPDWLFLIAREFNEIGEREKYLEYLKKACQKNVNQACVELNATSSFKKVSLSNWDPAAWKNEEIYGYKVIDVIGTGGTGYVLKSYKSGGYYALKIPTLSMVSNVVDMLGESAKLSELSDRSNYIVKLFGVYADKNDINEILSGNAEVYLKRPPVIAMELMEGGSSEDLRKVTNLVNSDYWKLIIYSIVAKIADALSIVHSEGYVHCDVKPQNILFSEKLPPYGLEAFNKIKNNLAKPKLADLGSAVRDGSKPNSYTPYYAPLEQVNSLYFGGIRKTADIYALGATAFKLLTGEPLNSKEMIDSMLKFEKTRDTALLSPSLYSSRDYSLLNGVVEPKVIEFIKSMTSPDPNSRPTAERVRDFFTSITY